MFYIRSSDYVHPTLNGFTLLSASFYFPHPQSLAVTCPPSVSMSLTFFRFHIKWNLKSLFFFVWLISLSRMPFNYVENRFCIKLSVFFFFFFFILGGHCFASSLKWKRKQKWKSLSPIWLFVSSWTVPARLLCPWDSPGKNTGVGSHSLPQGIFPTQGSNPVFLHFRLILHHLSHQGSPSQIFYVKCVILVCFLFPKIEQCICIWTCIWHTFNFTLWFPYV